jgi:hypothetical protein
MPTTLNLRADCTSYGERYRDAQSWWKICGDYIATLEILAILPRWWSE